MRNSKYEGWDHEHFVPTNLGWNIAQLLLHPFLIKVLPGGFFLSLISSKFIIECKLQSIFLDTPT